MPNFVVLDLVQLLDRSIAGSDAAKALERTWKAAQQEGDEKKRALFEDLEKKREGLKRALLERARPLVAEVAKKKGAQAVLEKGAVIWADAVDITAEVSAKVDALGPLKVP